MKKRRCIIVGLFCALSLQLSCFAAQDKINANPYGAEVNSKINYVAKNEDDSVSLREVLLFYSRYNNTKDYNSLYQALKNVDNEKFKGVAKTNLYIKRENDENACTFIGCNTIKINNNQDIEINRKSNINQINKKIKKDIELYKTNTTDMRLGDSWYSLSENDKWIKLKKENTYGYKESILKNKNIKNIQDTFNTIKINKISEKEYELDLNSSTSDVFRASFTKNIKSSLAILNKIQINNISEKESELNLDSSNLDRVKEASTTKTNANVDSIDMKQCILKVILNEKNEIIKLTETSKYEELTDGIKFIVDQKDEIIYDRMKVDIQKPSNTVSEDLIVSILEKGNKLYEEGKYQEALTCFDNVINIVSDNSAAYNGKAISLMGLEKYEEALTCINKCIDFSKSISFLETPVTYVNKGAILEELDKSVEALECYSHAIKLDSSCSKAYYRKALLYYTLEDYENAIKNYDMFIKLNPNDAEIYYLKASCHAKLNDTLKSIENIKKAVELDADYLDIISEDEDFDGIRNTDAFKNLIKDLEKKVG